MTPNDDANFCSCWRGANAIRYRMRRSSWISWREVHAVTTAATLSNGSQAVNLAESKRLELLFRGVL